MRRPADERKREREREREREIGDTRDRAFWISGWIFGALADISRPANSPPPRGNDYTPVFEISMVGSSLLKQGKGRVAFIFIFRYTGRLFFLLVSFFGV